MKTHKLQSGFGLVEIMIAMLIGLFLLGGIIQMFITSKQTYKMQDTVGRLQENQRFALDFLVHDLRGIGGWGCFRDQNYAQSLLNATGAYAAATSGISGTDGTTDTITLRSTSAVLTSAGTDVALTGTITDPTAALSVTQGSGILANDILFLGDCDSGNIFQVTSVTAGTGSSPDTIAHAAVAATTNLPGNASNSLTKPYNTSARVYRLNVVTYSIATGESGQPALFRQLGNAAATELIEGIEDMQILYGEDTDGDGTPNRYVTASSVADMNNAVSIQVSLLMRSLDDNQIPASIPFTFNGAIVAASQTDKRIRRSVTSIISVRNRLI